MGYKYLVELLDAGSELLHRGTFAQMESRSK
jgi:hypothetical protein